MGSTVQQKKRRVLDELARGDVLDYPVKRHASRSRWFDRVAYYAPKSDVLSVNKALLGKLCHCRSNHAGGNEHALAYLATMVELLSAYGTAAFLRAHYPPCMMCPPTRLLPSAAASTHAAELSLTAMQPHRAGSTDRIDVSSNVYAAFSLYSVLAHMQHDTVQLALLEILQLVCAKALPPSDWAPVLPNLLRVLTKHVENASIQHTGLPIVAFLCENELCRSRMQGGIELLLRVMKRHAYDGLLVCNAAAAICWLVHTGPDAGRARVEKDIRMVLICLLLHFKNAAVFGNLTCVLFGLPVPPALERTLVDIIREGMRFHLSCVKVQESCLRCLRHRRLSNCHDEMLETAPSILNAMRTHKDKHLQNQAFDILSMLVEGSAAMKDSLTDQGVADIALCLLTDPTTDLNIKRRALLFLNLLLPRDHDHPFGGTVATIEALWIRYASDAIIPDRG